MRLEIIVCGLCACLGCANVTSEEMKADSATGGSMNGSGNGGTTATGSGGADPDKGISAKPSTDGTGGDTGTAVGTGGEGPGSGGAAGDDTPDASTPPPDAGTSMSAAGGTLMGQVSINPAGYSGTGKGDVYIVVMDGNPTACALGGNIRPKLITQLVLVGVDLKGGAKAPYMTDKLPPGTYYASAFLDENATGKTNPQPDNGEFAAVDLSSFTPPKVTIVDGQQKTLDLLLNFAPPPLGGTNCAPK